MISNQFGGRSVTDVYNAVGVTAAALGNHEFDFGIPVLKERIAQARYPVLAANVFLKGRGSGRTGCGRASWWRRLA